MQAARGPAAHGDEDASTSAPDFIPMIPPPRLPPGAPPAQNQAAATADAGVTTGAGAARPRKKKKRFYRHERSLVLFLKSIVTRKVVVELRNDIIVRGKLEDCDEWMKCV